MASRFRYAFAETIEKPSGYFMYRQTLHENFRIVSTRCISLFSTIHTINLHYFPIQHLPISLSN